MGKEGRLTERLPALRSDGRASGPHLVGVLVGEGVGPEVAPAAVEVLEAAAPGEIRFRYGGPIGGEARRLSGAALTEEVARWCAAVFNEGGAILCGPGGDRFVYDLRRRFDLYVKLTPVVPMPALSDCGAVRPEVRRDVDLVVVRENAGGCYFGESARNGDGVRHEFGYRDAEVRRILDVAMRLAAARRRRIAVALKPGGLPALSDQWAAVFTELARQNDLPGQILEVDNLAYQIIAAARDFDVIVAPNLFGDVLSDVAALLLASRGLSFSGNFGEGGRAVYQTGHGAARDIAGRGIANPVGQILSAAMLLRESFGLLDAADAVETATAEVLAEGFRTADVAAQGSTVVGTAELAGRIAARVACRRPGRVALP